MIEHNQTGEPEALLEGLRALDQACGPDISKHDRVIVLIQACIEGGFDTKERILGALQRMDCHKTHAQIILSKSTGSNPSRHRWQRDEAGIYRNHP